MALWRLIVAMTCAGALALQSNDLCSCPTPTNCGCCAHLYVHDRVIHLNDTACVDVSYQKAAEKIDLDIKLNGRTIYEDEVALSDLTKECVGIPYIAKEAKICVDFDHLVLNTSYVGACAKIEVEVFKKDVLDVDVGCFHFDV